MRLRRACLTGDLNPKSWINKIRIPEKFAKLYKNWAVKGVNLKLRSRTRAKNQNGPIRRGGAGGEGEMYETHGSRSEVDCLTLLWLLVLREILSSLLRLYLNQENLQNSSFFV